MSTARSYFESLNPLAKLAWSFSLTIWLFTLRDLKTVLLVCCLIFITTYFLARINIMRYLKLSLILLAGGLFIVIYQAIFRVGPGIQIGSLTFSYVGLSIGSAIALRAFGIVAAALSFAETTKAKDLVIELVRIGIPYRNAYIAYFALRFLPVFQADSKILFESQQLRGMPRSLKRFTYSVRAMILAQFQRTDDLSISLENRGFGKFRTKFFYDEKHYSIRGYLVLVLTFIVMLFIQKIV